MTQQGRFILTAENDKDNALLFEVTNTAKLKGIHLKFGIADQNQPDAVKTPKEKRTPTKYVKPAPTHRCEVEGCSFKSSERGIASHTYRYHGVMKDGTVVTHIPDTHNMGRKIAIKAPVVKLPNGTYRIVPQTPSRSLLSDD